MVDTLQVDGLARITGLTQALYIGDSYVLCGFVLTRYHHNLGKIRGKIILGKLPPKILAHSAETNSCLQA